MQYSYFNNLSFINIFSLLFYEKQGKSYETNYNENNVRLKKKKCLSLKRGTKLVAEKWSSYAIHTTSQGESNDFLK